MFDLQVSVVGAEGGRGVDRRRHADRLSGGRTTGNNKINKTQTVCSFWIVWHHRSVDVTDYLFSFSVEIRTGVDPGCEGIHAEGNLIRAPSLNVSFRKYLDQN